MQKNLMGPRYKWPVSDRELKRRLDLTQAALKKENIDCLVLQVHSNIFDSNIRYFLDTQTGGYSTTLMIPADGGMIYITHGPDNDNAPIPPSLRNVEKVIANAFCPPFSFTDSSAAEIVEKEIKNRSFKKVGLAYLQLMGHGFGAHLTGTLADVEFVDFSNRLHEITAVKSAEEWDLIELSIRAHEKLMDMVPALIVPGRAEFEILADLEYQSHLMGCDTCGNVAVGSAKPGEVCIFVRHFGANRRIESGDNVCVMLEVSGPGGMYGELARTFCLSEPTESLLELFEVSKNAQHAVAAAAKPGVTGADLNRVFNEYVAGYGIGPNMRYVGHGQGYDMMESPAISRDETMVLKEDMLFAIHPELFKGSDFAICCDNFRITANGAELITRTPQKIFRI